MCDQAGFFNAIFTHVLPFLAGFIVYIVESLFFFGDIFIVFHFGLILPRFIYLGIDKGLGYNCSNWIFLERL
jgi:hypothetical protein